MTYDLILKGGRVIDPSQNLDRVTDVAFLGGKVAKIGDGLDDAGADVRDLSGFIVSPGLIDLHTHVYWGGTSLGIDADAFCRDSGVTTSVDTGSAGPGNFAGFRKHVIEPSQARILAYLHVSFAGIYAFSNTVMVGESEDTRMMAPKEAAEVADANRDVIVGIKVRVGKHASGDQGTAPLNIALQVADEVGMPLMAHIDHPPPSYEEVIDMLRPGDVLTHCFRPFPNAPCTAQGTVKQAVLDARKRGVIFDIGHGKGSFAFKTARAMLANGFYPGHDLVRHPHALHRRPGFRPGHDAVEVPLPRHGAARGDQAHDRECRDGAEAPRARQPEARQRRRRDDPVGARGQVRLCRRRRRAPDRRPQDRLRGRGDRRALVASQALAEQVLAGMMRSKRASGS